MSEPSLPTRPSVRKISPDVIVGVGVGVVPPEDVAEREYAPVEVLYPPAAT